jgi:hypothetical protein
MLADFKVFMQTFEKNSFEPRPSLFLSLPSPFFSLPPLFCPVEGQQLPVTSPAMPPGELRQRTVPQQALTSPWPNRPPLPRIRPCPTRAHHAAIDSRWPSHDTPRPCPGRTSLSLAAPSPSSPSLCAYKRAASSPCSRASVYNHRRAISAVARPRRRAPPSAPLPPKSSP